MVDQTELRQDQIYTLLARKGFRFQDIIRCTEELDPLQTNPNTYALNDVTAWIDSNTKHPTQPTRK